MKFAIAIALCVLSQCFVADAWYVYNWSFNNFINDSAAERDKFSSGISDLESFVNSANNRVSAFVKRYNTLISRIDGFVSSESNLNGKLDTGLSGLADLTKVIDRHAELLAKFATMNKCVYSDRTIIESLYLEISN